MDQQPSRKLNLNIHGMHCASCEVLIERKWKKIAGVEKVNVNHATGKATVICSHQPNLTHLQEAVAADGYTVSVDGQSPPSQILPSHRNSRRDYIEIGAVFLIVVALYEMLKGLDLIPKSLGVADNMSYSVVFLIGLVAAASTCIAVTGGLLLAVAAKYNERHPHLTGRQKFRPHLSFNLGRIVSYTVLGGALGAFGSLFALSPKATGIITIAASLAMILLGFQLLHLFPGLKRFQPKMPKFLAHRIHDATDSDSNAAPFFLGAGTFFLPCGFTQALQLYVLSKGDWKVGAITMLVFSLGTLPALLSLSAISSFARGAFQKYFLKFAAVIVILLGFANINNGLALTGVDLGTGFTQPATKAVVAAGHDPNVQLVDGRQIVRMRVNGFDYEPSQFTITQNIPVEWVIDGTQAGGCAQVITAPDLNITEYLPRQGTKTISFTPERVGKFRFSCTMGMTTPGAAFNVVANPNGTTASPTPSAPTPAPAPIASTACDPERMQCLTQKISMEVSRERGFTPSSFTVKKGVPVELEVDAKVQLRGCMGTMVIPDYNVAQRIPLGKTTLRFTPTQTGSTLVTCSMGNPLAEITVTN
jgi:sulfite exporter TauE/SafE/copper chaperone CopZ